MNDGSKDHRKRRKWGRREYRSPKMFPRILGWRQADEEGGNRERKEEKGEKVLQGLRTEGLAGPYKGFEEKGGPGEPLQGPPDTNGRRGVCGWSGSAIAPYPWSTLANSFINVACDQFPVLAAAPPQANRTIPVPTLLDQVGPVRPSPSPRDTSTRHASAPDSHTYNRSRSPSQNNSVGPSGRGPAIRAAWALAQTTLSSSSQVVGPFHLRFSTSACPTGSSSVKKSLCSHLLIPKFVL